ncbi:ATPase family AAA domain-containing protein 5-like [Physella acuta]|uniref:ATPase family AAA domain-containing protein 5-like n=1 Tax=Physella acuta TaxID=109671 RepID=UPI0027DAC6FD|nr:ATPase family AAA domain-containing protein 5-like [Physella acuta]
MTSIHSNYNTEPESSLSHTPKSTQEKKRKSMSLSNGRSAKLNSPAPAPQKSSDPAPHQIAESVSYEDYLQQLASGDKPVNKSSQKSSSHHKLEQASLKQFPTAVSHSSTSTGSITNHISNSSVEKAKKINHSVEDNADKSQMSYKEFLNLFKPPGKQNVTEVTSDPDEAAPDTHAAPVKCKSITSYFTKTVNSPVQPSHHKASATMLVTAEVHSGKRNACKRSHSPDKPSPAAHKSEENADDIILLSTETIEDAEPKGSNILNFFSKKRKIEEVPKTESKSQKFKNKEDTAKCVNPKIESISKSVDPGSVFNSKALTSEDLSNAITEGSAGSHSKHSQSTLCFGKKGLSLSKSEHKKDISLQLPPQNDGFSKKSGDIKKSDGQAQTTEGKIKKSDGQAQTSEGQTKKSDGQAQTTEGKTKKSDGQAQTSEGQTKKSDGQAQTTEGKTKKSDDHCKKLGEASTLCHQPNSSREVLGQSSSSKNTSSNRRESKRNLRVKGHSDDLSSSLSTDTPAVVSTPESTADLVNTPEYPTLRRSSRISRSVKFVEVEDDVMEVDSDSSEDTDLSKSSKRKPTKKTTGKLAPIFTLVKTKEDQKPAVPKEDPETLRRRREFLMSGIPEELKRQITISTSQTISLDYPPWPEVSHVQQLPSTSCHVPANLNLKERLVGSSLDTVKWNSSSWSCFRVKDFSGNLVSQNLSLLPALQDMQVNQVLQHFQLSDPKFPFSQVYSNLQARLLSCNLISESTELADPDVVIVDDSPSPASTPGTKTWSDPKDCLWTELHQPESSEQIIGNVAAVKQLKHWLLEWKNLMQREARKENSTKMKSKTKGTSTWSDSDFTDSEDEDSALCNTFLITGPHGCGKTSSVYALAQELDFKVFEVNSSSLRSGKQLLSQLEEATQSHRVAQNKVATPAPQDNLPTESSKNMSKKSEKTKSKSAASKASGFANLFSSHSKVAKPSESKAPNEGSANKKSKDGKVTKHENKLFENNRKKDSKSKSKAEKNESCVDVKLVAGGSTSGSLNLASASLILFDEVDVVFEEDKGFLSTVQHFMTSTKIPIILTSTNSGFSQQLAARHEHISYRQPPLVSATSFLCTVCLAHGVRVSRRSVSNMLQHMKGDVRRCLLYLQYWCGSGGGRVKAQKCLSPPHPRVVQETSQCDTTDTPDDRDSDTDFVCLRPGRRAGRMICDDEDSGKSNSSCSSSSSGTSAKNGVIIDGESGVQVPELHKELEETMLGLAPGCKVSIHSVIKHLKSSTLQSRDLNELLYLCHVLRQALQLDVTYLLALHCLPLPKSAVPVTSGTLVTTQSVESHDSAQPRKKIRKRIIQGDWFDSDDEDDPPIKSSMGDNPATLDGSIKTNVGDNPAALDTHVKFSSDANSCISRDNSGFKSSVEMEATNVQQVEDSTKSEWNKVCNSATISVLTEMARYYDTTSYVDCLETFTLATSDRSKGLSPGMDDEEQTGPDEVCGEWSWQLAGTARILGCWRLGYSCRGHWDRCVRDGTKLSGCQTSGSTECQDWKTSLELPVGEKIPEIWKAHTRSQETAVRRMCKTSEPIMLGSNPALYTDYLPTLRAICHAEDLKDKRRRRTCRKSSAGDWSSRYHHWNVDQVSTYL